MKSHLAHTSTRQIAFGSLYLLVGCFLCVLNCEASLFPEERLIDWSQSGVSPTIAQNEKSATKVGSNIPHRTEIGATVVDFGAIPNDNNDDTEGFLAAIAATAPGKVCFVPPGVYHVNKQIRLKDGITLRGAGPNSTIIQMTGPWSGITFAHHDGGMQSNYLGYSSRISGGSTRNSGELQIDDIYAAASWLGPIKTGDNLVVSEVDDASLVSKTTYNGTITWGDGWGGSRNRGQIVEVLSITEEGHSAKIKIKPALFTNYRNEPMVTRFLKRPLIAAGLEDVTLHATARGLPEVNILFENARDCWVYNVKSDFASQNHVRLAFSLRCEIRKSHFYEAFYHTSGNDNEIGVMLKSTSNLVIDNIVERLHAGIIVDKGAAGNVIAYNYVTGEYDDSEASGNRALQFGICSNHGAHPQFNLFEGNIAQRFVADAFWGTSSHITILRNWFSGSGVSKGPYSTRTGKSGEPYPLVDLRRAIDIWQGNSHYSAVGNILGDASTTGAVYKSVNPDPNRNSRTPYIWQLDNFHNYNNDAAQIQWGPLASPTLIDHGNFDYVNKKQTWDNRIPNRDIPASLFLNAAPKFFGSLKWPPFDPASNTNPKVDAIPAGYRALNGGTEPPNAATDQAPTNPRISISPSTTSQ